MPEGGDVWRRDGREYLARCGQDLRPSHRRAMEARLACRAEAWGGQLLPCAHGGREHDVSHAWRNRSGPTCHPLDTAAWLAERRQARWPVPYLRGVLTLPQARRALVRATQQDL
jgi:hypothetical protein